MEYYSIFSYLTAALGYFALLIVLVINRKNNTLTLPFSIAVLISIVWAAYSAYAVKSVNLYVFDALPFETLRNGAWYYFISVLISQQLFNSPYRFLREYWQPQAMLILIALVFWFEVHESSRYWLYQLVGFDFRIYAHLGFAIIGFFLVEQLYRNAYSEQRWHIKFICIALDAMFVVDFIIYSKSLLFHQLDLDLWNARGLVNGVLVPLLVLSVNRLNIEPYKFKVSKQVIFHTTALIGAGVYLLLMSFMGFYIRDYGGSWGSIAQTGFIVIAILLLLVFFSSGKARAVSKIYLTKHFFQHRYDYRDEWIKLSKNLSQLHSLNEISGFIVSTMSDLVDSSGGGIWLKNEQGDYYLAEELSLGFDGLNLIKKSDYLVRFIIKTQWVIDFVEYHNQPEMYEECNLQEWLEPERGIWLVVPIFIQNQLEALVILSKPRVTRQIDWQDHDLLKTAAMQLGTALALTKASDDLSRSRQFEAYNRLSAFLVHDLKNLVAQIALIVKNSEKHKANPEFIDDSIETLENVVSKMQRILNQLKKDHQRFQEPAQKIDLIKLIHEVVKLLKNKKPVPEISINTDYCQIEGNVEKMSSVFTHLLQNAQDATDDSGWVKISLQNHQGMAEITISDNGCGMDELFIQQRLFKPFDTTKGNAGMGIGVYEAKEYVQQHSGSINVESKIGEGTIFLLKLPLI